MSYKYILSGGGVGETPKILKDLLLNKDARKIRILTLFSKQFFYDIMQQTFLGFGT